MHNKLRHFFLIILPLFCVNIALVSGEEALPEAHTKAGACESCHTQRLPVMGDSDLRPCPISHVPVPEPDEMRSADEGPKVIMLDKIMEKFDPTKFDHETHAKMGRLGDGCLTCHHHAEEGTPRACKECHKTELIRDELHIPRLKAVYHQRCLFCHQEWSHETKCEVCHTEKGQERKITFRKDASSPYFGIKRPITKIYTTAEFDNTKIIFHHLKHTEDYGLSCSNCHEKTNCAACHDTQKDPKTADPALRASHDENSCFKCHAETSCEQCHKTQ